MRSVKIILFLVLISLAFQAWANQFYCDIPDGQKSSDMSSEIMNSSDHDCCDDESTANDSCQCSAAAVFVIPEKVFLGLDDVISAVPNVLNPKLFSIPTSNIFHPPRYC